VRGHAVQLFTGEPSATTAVFTGPGAGWVVFALFVLMGFGIIARVQFVRTRARRMSDSERAFRRLASMRGLPVGSRLIARELAAAHGSATPAAILLSDHALNRGVQRLAPRPGSAQHKALTRFLAARSGASAGEPGPG
jgi:hypothetical protein